MKRSNPNSGKKTHIPSDFKRLKAKVGKRAPQKANVTDTKFKTASVQVKSQTINASAVNTDKNGETSRKDMVTSKGKHLSQLLAQLHHPSPSVRISSLHGMKDATKSTPNEVIFNHLAALIPSLSKSMVDDDSKVRKLAKSIFHDIIKRIISNHAKEKMIPFLPLSLAYVASALHSLDQDVRFDGCIALEILCTNFGQELRKGKDMYSLFKTIPAFVTLFDDVSGGAASVARRGIGDIGSIGSSSAKNSSKKKQRNKSGAKSKTAEKSIGILRSFVSVFKVTTLRGNDEVDTDRTWTLNDHTMKRLRPNGATLLPSLDKSNLSFLQGGVGSNSIVWKNDFTKTHSKDDCRNVHDLSIFINKSNATRATSQLDELLKLKTQIELLNRLRNRIVEVTQEGTYENFGLSISSNHIHDLSLLVAALRLLWNCHPRYFDKEDEAKVKFLSYDGKTNEWKKFKKTANILLKLLLETFPLRDPSGNAANYHNYNLLNASICCAISEFGSVLDQPKPNEDRSKVQCQWVDDIFSYLLPKLREDDNELKSEEIQSITQSSRVTLMKVVEQLLLRQESGVYFLENKEKHLELISTLASLFFSSSKKPSERLCRSLEGRRAVYILLSLIAEHFQAWNEIDSEYWDILSQMASVLPIYIMMWKDSFQKESSLILSTLLSVTRRYDLIASNDTLKLSDFCAAIQEAITKLFVAEQRETDGGTHHPTLSIFESFPSRATQKLAVSLIGVLKHPSKVLLSSLGQICARYNLNNEANLDKHTVDYIHNVIYSIRSTIDFEAYVDFLVESVGMTENNLSSISKYDHVEENSNGYKVICSLDPALAMSSRYMCLLLSEDERVISILSPQFIKWLDCSTNNKSSSFLLVKARAAMVYIACWSLHYTENQNCHLLLHKDLRLSVSKAISDLFLDNPDLFKEHNIEAVLPVLVSTFNFFLS